MSIEPISPELKQLIDAESAPPVPPGVEARLLNRLDRSIDAAGAAGLVASGSLLAKTAGGALLFLLGVATGAILYSRVAPPVAPIVVVVAPPTAVEPVAAPAPAAEPVPPKPPPAPAPTATRSPPAPVRATGATTLEAERRLLEPARTALGRGLVPTAISLLRKHASDFPKGQLAEEREALLIQALEQSGEDGEARRLAAEFESKYPQSLLLPVVRRALQR